MANTRNELEMMFKRTVEA